MLFNQASELINQASMSNYTTKKRKLDWTANGLSIPSDTLFNQASTLINQASASNYTTKNESLIEPQTGCNCPRHTTKLLATLYQRIT
jgi:hypothetical protein